MHRVFVLDGIRSHIGRENGMFRGLTAEYLGAAVLRELAVKHPDLLIDRIIAGNAVGTGGNITRLAALHAGLPENVPAVTIDAQCASGLCSIQLAEALIRAGICNAVIAGGFESASTQARRIYHPRDDRYQGDIPYVSAQFSPQERSETAMLDGAERVAQKYGISREELDAQALSSHQKASASMKLLDDADIIISIKGSTADESVRANMRKSLLSRMPAVSGTLTTAGNACTKNDGAAFVILCSEEYICDISAEPKAEIMQSSLIAGDPLYSPVCAQLAAEELISKSGFAIEDIAAFEFNEAFAVITVLFAQAYPHLYERLNPLGGALAYGHPYGASGAVVLLHLLQSLGPKDHGICAVASAGGQGSAMLVQGLAVS